MKFDDIRKEYAELEARAETEYWEYRASFIETLKKALQDGNIIRSFNSIQLLQFVGWCSSFRPEEPHIILSDIARAFREHNG